MRQRLGLAAALLRRPTLLLLDEPANGMDPAGIREFRTLLRSLAGDGTTVFLSSHLLAEVEQVCDQVAVLQAGAAGRSGAGRRAGDGADRGAGRGRSGRPGHRAGSARAVGRPAGRARRGLVGAPDGRMVNEVLGQGGIWAQQIVLKRPGLEETFLELTGARWEANMRLLRAELMKLVRPLTWGVAGAAAVFCVLLAVGGAHNAALEGGGPGRPPPLVCRARDPGRAARARAPGRGSGPGWPRPAPSPRRSPRS